MAPVVICINNYYERDFLTVGKEYPVLAQRTLPCNICYVRIEDDRGRLHWVNLNRFEWKLAPPLQGGNR